MSELETIIQSSVDVDSIASSKYFLPFSNFSSDLCLANILFDPILYCGFITNLDELVSKLTAMPDELRIKRFVCSISTESPIDSQVDSKSFLGFILSLNLDDSAKLGIINCYHNYDSCVSEVAELIRPIVDCITQNESLFNDRIAEWKADIESIGCFDQFVSDHYHFQLPTGEYMIFPTFMCGLLMDIFAWNDEYSGSGMPIGAIASSYGMVKYIDALSNESKTIRTVEILKGLADETRFELLKCINDAPTYGTALAEKFDMTHQKIFYHMSKMLVPGIVECNAQNGKTYYSINRKTIDELIDALQQFSSKKSD